MLAHCRLIVSAITSSVRYVHVWSKAEGLLSSDKIPHVITTPYILSGYRPPEQPWKYYLYSIFSLHNESVNVWTHAVGFFIVLLRLVVFFKDNHSLPNKVEWTVLWVGISCLITLTFSATAHLFHSRSKWHHYLFFFVDYAGVTLFSFASSLVGMFVVPAPSYHNVMITWFHPANVFLSWFSFWACCAARSRPSLNDTRRKIFMLSSVVLHAVFGALPTIPRYLECFSSTTCSLTSLNHITVVLVFFSFCAITFAGHFPESRFPGRLDILGHSHQIFHILAVATMLLLFRCMDVELSIKGSAFDIQSNPGHICASFIAILVLEAATYLYYISSLYKACL